MKEYNRNEMNIQLILQYNAIIIKSMIVEDKNQDKE